MRLRGLAGLGFVGAFLGSFLAAGVAAAQYPPPPPPGYAPAYAPPDGPRFRGGVGLEGGAFIAPSIVNLGGIGVAGQLGVQINNNWGVYAVPTLDILFGSGVAGVGVSAAVMGDYTFNEIPLSVGAGFEGGDFAVFGSDAVGGGVYYGARARVAYYPVLVRSDFNPRRRKGLYIALDLHLDGNGWGGAAACAGVCVAASTGGFLFSPMIGIGYQAF